MSQLWKSLMTVLAAATLCALGPGCDSDEAGEVAGPGTPAAVLETAAIPIGYVGTYIPQRISGSGDLDFKGHGPEITILAELHVVADTVWSFVYMRAEETFEDWTAGEGWWAKNLYEAPPGWQLNRVLNPMYCQVQYTDDDHESRVDRCPIRCDPDCRYSGFTLDSTGDTDGDDVGTRTSVAVGLDTLFVELRQR